VTTEEASWIGSLLSVGGFVGSFLFNFIIEMFGKKIGLILLALPQMAFWLCVIFGNSVQYLYLARIFLGITGGGMVIVLPLYVADIAEKQ
jgi:SP family facilitated glucose transporter-like MFS transporter 8